MKVGAGAGGRWFANAGSVAGATPLFCLPYAGGGAGAYRGWQAAMPAAVRIQAVALPGREARIGEPAEFDLGELADAVADRIGGPYALYGHSMGGRLAFELVRELARRDLPPPLRLYVGASRPPDVVDPLGSIARLDDDGLIRRVTALGGTPPEVFEEPELRELLLPVLRADFRWIDGYRYRPGPPLGVPIVALAASDDETVSVDTVRGWQRHTARRFRLHTVRGGHFFLTTALAQVTEIIAADLLDARAATASAETAGDHESGREVRS